MNTDRTVYVVPVAGRIVPDPARDGTDLPANGRAVPRSPYWLRALAAGDVKEGAEATENRGVATSTKKGETA